eukprot:161936_1
MTNLVYLFEISNKFMVNVYNSKLPTNNSYKKDISDIISNINEVTDDLLSGTSYLFSGINTYTDNSYAQTKQPIFNKYIQMGKEFINTKSLLQSNGNELDELNKIYDNITIEMNELTRLNDEQLNNINDKNVSLNINNEYKINNALKLNKMQQLCTVSKDQVGIDKLENKECNNDNNNKDVIIDIDNRFVDNNGSGTLNSENNKQLETLIINNAKQYDIVKQAIEVRSTILIMKTFLFISWIILIINWNFIEMNIFKNVYNKYINDNDNNEQIEIVLDIKVKQNNISNSDREKEKELYTLILNYNQQYSVTQQQYSLHAITIRIDQLSSVNDTITHTLRGLGVITTTNHLAKETLGNNKVLYIKIIETDKFIECDIQSESKLRINNLKMHLNYGLLIGTLNISIKPMKPLKPFATETMSNKDNNINGSNVTSKYINMNNIEFVILEQGNKVMKWKVNMTELFVNNIINNIIDNNKLLYDGYIIKLNEDISLYALTNGELIEDTNINNKNEIIMCSLTIEDINSNNNYIDNNIYKKLDCDLGCVIKYFNNNNMIKGERYLQNENINNELICNNNYKNVSESKNDFKEINNINNKQSIKLFIDVICIISFLCITSLLWRFIQCNDKKDEIKENVMNEESMKLNINDLVENILKINTTAKEKEKQLIISYITQMIDDYGKVLLLLIYNIIYCTGAGIFDNKISTEMIYNYGFIYSNDQKMFNNNSMNYCIPMKQIDLRQYNITQTIVDLKILNNNNNNILQIIIIINMAIRER